METLNETCKTCLEVEFCGFCDKPNTCADCCGCGLTYSDFVTVVTMPDGSKVEICEGCYKPVAECDRDWCI